MTPVGIETVIPFGESTATTSSPRLKQLLLDKMLSGMSGSSTSTLMTPPVILRSSSFPAQNCSLGSGKVPTHRCNNRNRRNINTLINPFIYPFIPSVVICNSAPFLLAYRQQQQQSSPVFQLDIDTEESSAAGIALRTVASQRSSVAFLLGMAANNSNSPTAAAAPQRMMSRQSSVTRRLKVDGREIQQDHAQYALTYGMMLGIRVTVGYGVSARPGGGAGGGGIYGSAESSSSGRLREAQFAERIKLKFLPEGNRDAEFPTPPHKLNQAFKFKDYAPAVFRRLRALAGIDEREYVGSLAGDNLNYIEFLANSKSGQYFFYSNCGRYMIKTQTKRECKVLLKMLPSYLEHLRAHPATLLVRFFGMHKVRMKFLKPRGKIYFVVMSSVFNSDKNVHVKYDLKGSTVGRFTPDSECLAGAVRKDQNLMKSGIQLLIIIVNLVFNYCIIDNNSKSDIRTPSRLTFVLDLC